MNALTPDCGQDMLIMKAWHFVATCLEAILMEDASRSVPTAA